MTKVWKAIVSTVLILLLIVGIFAGGYYLGKHPELIGKTYNKSSNETSSPLSEKITITEEDIRVKLVEIKEISTYEGKYAVKESVNSNRFFLDNIKVPLTKNKITIECNGIIKVGCDIEDIGIQVDNDSKKIYIKLPPIQVNDNYIILDSVKCKETNNILNPIDYEDYRKLFSEMEEKGLKKAEKKGIYKKAEENMKLTIKNAISGFEEYKVVFM